MYKIGDSYTEKVKKFDAFDSNMEVVSHYIDKVWEIIKVNEFSILCKCNEEYKCFERKDI